MSAPNALPPMRALAILAALAVLIPAFAYRIWRGSHGVPLPALLDNLDPASQTQASQDRFIDRLRQRFPAGSSEEALTRDLRAEGFTVTAQGATFDRRSDFNDICRRGGNVHWTVEGGKIASVTGGYYVHCP